MEIGGSDVIEQQRPPVQIVLGEMLTEAMNREAQARTALVQMAQRAQAAETRIIEMEAELAALIPESVTEAGNA